jgi:hypothetical protein
VLFYTGNAFIRGSGGGFFMDRNEILKMLKEEIASKVDVETLKKLETAGSKDEALSILSEASVEIDEEKLAIVSGGENLEGELLENGLQWNCPTACDWHFCPGACTDFDI